MENQRASKEIDNLINILYGCCEWYYKNHSEKEAKRITDKLCIKIDALERGKFALEQIMLICGEELLREENE